ncbi:MAG: CBS domain-containing protein, partial [Dehalococcoidales bacterium]|nr:CBS domain-containing protein [Dehalococcoidales bacterium]
SESLGVVLGWLAERRERSFAVVLDEDDRFACVLSAEAIYRFISRKMMEGADYEGILRLPAGEAARTLQDGHNFGAVRNAALVMRDAISVRAAGEVMGEENVSVTVVLDENDRPTGYITAEDIRQLSLAAR